MPEGVASVQFSGEQQLEGPPQPNLAEDYGNPVLTLFGHTGTFEDLKTMCPVNLNAMPTEVSNEFFIKAANESGLEIKAEHVELFNETLERNGLERNYTVAEPEPQPKPERPQDIETQTTEQAEASHENRDTERQTPGITEQPPTTEPLEQVATVTAHQARQAEVEVMKRLVEVVEAETTPQQVAPPKQQPPSTIKHTASKPSTARTTRPAKSHPKHSPGQPSQPYTTNRTVLPAPPPASRPARSVQPAGEVTATAPAVEAPLVSALSMQSEQKPPAPEQDDAYHLSHTAVAERETEVDTTPGDVAVAEVATEYEPPERRRIDSLHDELLKDDLDVFDDVTQALWEFTGAIEMAGEIQPNPDEADIESMDTEDQSLIVAQVAEQLSLLEADDKKTVAPLLKDIVGAIHGILILEARDAPPALVAETREQLGGLCRRLCETLGLEYSETDIERFVLVLLRPELRLGGADTQESTVVDLTREGTHEAKRFSAPLSARRPDIYASLRQVLGMFALTTLRVGPRGES